MPLITNDVENVVRVSQIVLIPNRGTFIVAMFDIHRPLGCFILSNPIILLGRVLSKVQSHSPRKQ